MSATIDYGIDLGTTNSSIASISGTGTEIIANREGSLQTPSAVWIDKRGTLYVGRVAREHHVEDEENTAVEFKLHMGEEWKIRFSKSEREMSPEELSAEILKSLRTDVHNFRGELLDSIVITVPAAFDVPQSMATNRAAELAGFRQCLLLQEPVAAALAYGFQSAGANGFQLVYDFGGGTFDAAILGLKEGTISVVNHKGDNYLGGKNIDWDIVETLLVPFLKSQYALEDFDRSHREWRGAFAKLKAHAEDAKIQVSRTRKPQEIFIENLCSDANGTEVELLFTLTPEHLEKIVAPLASKSIALCRSVLAEAGIGIDHIDKILLVGGTSLLPCLQDRIHGELCPRTTSEIDPMTVVARGAAIFASTQKKVVAGDERRTGAYALNLQYEPVGNDTSPIVAGKVFASGRKIASYSGFALEFIETTSQWRSGNVAIDPEGTFFLELSAEPGRRCEYRITLLDDKGNPVDTEPNSIHYTVGNTIETAPLTHTVGVAMADNRPDLFFRKGDSLPNRSTRTHRTVTELDPKRQGEIRIPIVEGEDTEQADRNSLIGYLTISSGDPRLRRRLPVGSEVEITIAIDASRTVRTEAYIPLLEEVFEEVFRPVVTLKPVEKMDEDFKAQKMRLEKLREQVHSVDSREGREALERVDDQGLLATAERQVAAAHGNDDSRGEAEKRLLDLKRALDDVERRIEFQVFIKETNEALNEITERIEQYGDQKEKTAILETQRSIRSAAANRNRDTIERLLLEARILSQHAYNWELIFLSLHNSVSRMKNADDVLKLLFIGIEAMKRSDRQKLEQVVRALISLLPEDEIRASAGALAVSGYGGGTKNA